MSENLCLDSNVLIDLLGGDKNIASLTQGCLIHISVATRIELLSWPKLRPDQIPGTRALLTNFKVHPLDDAVELQAIEFRRAFKMKLGDSIIAATAFEHELPLLTSDKHFARLKNVVEVRML